MFSIEQLQAFVTTVETGSFLAAARRLSKVQSVVSQHIINLEIDCNATLFERNGRYPKLSDANKTLLPQAQALLNQHQRLKNSVLALTDNTPTEITMALDEGIPFKTITNSIGVLHAKFPHITLEFLSASSLDIVDMLREEQALTGIIFSELAIPSYLDFECIGSVKFDLYVAQSHPLADQVCENIDGLLPNHVAAESVQSGELVRLPLEFKEMGWQANVDVLQHQRHSNLEVFKLLRNLFRNRLQS